MHSLILKFSRQICGVWNRTCTIWISIFLVLLEIQCLICSTAFVSDITRIFNSVLLQQSQMMDSHGETTITTLYTQWLVFLLFIVMAPTVLCCFGFLYYQHRPKIIYLIRGKILQRSSSFEVLCWSSCRSEPKAYLDNFCQFQCLMIMIISMLNVERFNNFPVAMILQHTSIVSDFNAFKIKKFFRMLLRSTMTFLQVLRGDAAASKLWQHRFLWTEKTFRQSGQGSRLVKPNISKPGGVLQCQRLVKHGILWNLV